MRIEQPGPTNSQGKNFRIEELWAWTTVDPSTNSEGVVAYRHRTGGALPLVMTTREMAMGFRSKVQEIARVTGQPITLKRFDRHSQFEEVVMP